MTTVRAHLLSKREREREKERKREREKELISMTKPTLKLKAI